MDVTSLAKVHDLLNTVLLSKPRDQGWLDYYSKFIQASDLNEDAVERADDIGARSLQAAIAEAAFAKFSWEGDYTRARGQLEEVVADIARSDEKLAGWHNIWIGACYEHEGDSQTARVHYSKARGQISPSLILYQPMSAAGSGTVDKPKSQIVERLLEYVTLGKESFRKQLRKMTSSLIWLNEGTPRQSEESVRYLGELLGFEAKRPDNDSGAGPDVIWIDNINRQILSFELKTDKLPASVYNKADVGQSLNHVEWLSENYPQHESLGVFMVGSCVAFSTSASPGSEIFITNASRLVELKDALIALLQDTNAGIPLLAQEKLTTATEAGYSLLEIKERLALS